LAFGFGFVFGFCLALKCHKKSKESRRKTERKEKTDRIAAHKYLLGEIVLYIKGLMITLKTIVILSVFFSLRIINT